MTGVATWAFRKTAPQRVLYWCRPGHTPNFAAIEDSGTFGALPGLDSNRRHSPKQSDIGHEMLSRDLQHVEDLS